MNTTSITLPNDVMLGSVRDLIREGHPVVIMTKGVSMLPFITGGKDSVLLVAPDGLRKGDIALAEVAPGKYVLHRVREVSAERVVLQGDGNYRGRELCRPSDVCGRVREIQHPGGRVTDPSSPGQQRRWLMWTALPALFRRYLLAFYRRIKKISI